jgi:hypothetical protein
MNFFEEQYKAIANIFKKMGSLKLSLAAFIILLLFIVIVEKPGSHSMDKIVAAQPFIFPRLQINNVTHVTILLSESGNGTIEIRKENDQWIRNEKRVEPDIMIHFLDAIYDLRKGSTVSKNPARQSLYGVSENEGVRIQFWKNSRDLIDFYLGKETGVNQQYFRLVDENEVLQVEQLNDVLSPLINPVAYPSALQ